MKISYKLVKPKRGKYWLIRLATRSIDGWQEKSTKETQRRAAERVAAQIVAGLVVVEARRMTWKTFRARYEADHLSTLSRPGCFKSAANKLESMVTLTYLDELDAPAMKQWRHKMLTKGMPSTTVSSYLKHVRASLGWAEECGYIKHAPRVRTGSTSKMKGRALTGEEFDKLILNTVKVVGRKRDAQWKRLLWGLWHLGLRLQEALDFSWDDDEFITPYRLNSSTPMLRYPVMAHKNRKDQLVPITPEAATFLRSIQPNEPTGRVFPVMGGRKPMTVADRVSREISKIGKKALVVTSGNSAKKRHATAHDLRRSFAKRLAPKLNSVQLQLMMRHADSKTTRVHYAEVDAEQLAREIAEALQ